MLVLAQLRRPLNFGHEGSVAATTSRWPRLALLPAVDTAIADVSRREVPNPLSIEVCRGEADISLNHPTRDLAGILTNERDMLDPDPSNRRKESRQPQRFPSLADCIGPPRSLSLHIARTGKTKAAATAALIVLPRTITVIQPYTI
jgi:hypothetical protein